MYQRASLKYGARYDTSKWLMTHLPKRPSDKERLCLLDVGALLLGYEKYAATVQADYINLQPPPGHLAMSIRQRDLFDVTEKYDIVCLSLVLNFVPHAVDRGRMLRKARELVGEGGFVYVVLPRACVVNSRYLDEEELNAIMHRHGLECIAKHYSTKLYYGLFQITVCKEKDIKEEEYKPREKHAKGKRNNFKIQL